MTHLGLLVMKAQAVKQKKCPSPRRKPDTRSYQPDFADMLSHSDPKSGSQQSASIPYMSSRHPRQLEVPQQREIKDKGFMPMPPGLVLPMIPTSLPPYAHKNPNAQALEHLHNNLLGSIEPIPQSLYG